MRRKLTKLIFSLLFLLSASVLLLNAEMGMAENNTIPVNVGVVLDMDKWFGKMWLSCISMALSDFYASHAHYKTRILLNASDSKGDVVVAAAAALDLIKNVQVQAILGPRTSMEAEFVASLGEKSQVPIISFSATSPSISRIRTPYFVRATQNDSTQVRAISAIIRAFGWREVVLIYVDNEFGEGIVPFLVDALQEIDARIPYRSVIPRKATDDQVSAELYKLMTMQTRVFVLHMGYPLASTVFTKAKEVGLMSEDCVWIVTDGVGNGLSRMGPLVIDSMQGVLGLIPYIPRTKQLEDFKVRWKTKYQPDNPTVLNAELDVFGLWAYDAATALAMAVEKIGAATKYGVRKLGNYSNGLGTIGESQNGPKLLQALLSTKFKGLTGDFQIVDGQLQSSGYQIVNVIGKGERGIGFWSAENGIVRKLITNGRIRGGTGNYSTSKGNLGSIIWPGDTTTPPKGWVVPTNGKKLRIGVPVKYGISKFVRETKNLSTNRTTVTGFCIDVFDAVMKALPYGVPYEYIPFPNPDGKAGTDYNDLVYQVYLGNFDAVVGDTTIIANRSNYVDFTLPYTESGVSMIAKMRDSKRKNAWAFLKPLTRDLWVTSFCSFVFIGFVVWFLEHRINEDFRGPPSHQAGMIFWFSFSTMVFAHKEKVVNNLARFVVIIWYFVVLILTQSYTASLTSMLTVQQLQPTVTDLNQLKKNGEFVGYPKGSFVHGLLTEMGFQESKLRAYRSLEECHELFSEGSGRPIAAAFDEIPYLKLFVANYCSEYTMVAPTYKANGFGFVFPIGSPLVNDVSRAILNVTEGEKMREIERAWLGEASCPDSSSSPTTNSLSLESFWGLFLIAGIASFSALVIYIVMFLHKHKHVLSHSDDQQEEASTWRKMAGLARHFDKRDCSSHTFRKNGDQREEKRVIVDVMEGAPSVSPISNQIHSPHCFSNLTCGNCSSIEGTPCHENGNTFSHGQAPQEAEVAIDLDNPIQEDVHQEFPSPQVRSHYKKSHNCRPKN